MKLSKKQIDYVLNSTYDFNFSAGAIRSGKTHTQLIRFIEFITGDHSIPNTSVLVIGRTLESVRRNFYNDVLKLIDQNDIRENWRDTKAPLEIEYLPKKIQIVFVGANDESAESKVRGMTCQAVFGDEVTLWPRNIFEQSIGRCSAGLRYKFYTMNPDRPTHYIKTDYIDNNKLTSKTWNFTLDDNPALAPEYIDTIKSSFTGVMYDRMIMGRWVAVQEGAVFYNFKRECIVDSRLDYDQKAETFICWDFGVSDPTAIIAIQIHQCDKTPETPRGIILNIINCYQNTNKDAAHYAEVVKSWGYDDAVHYGDPAGGSRDSGLYSWFHRLRQAGIMIQYPPRMSVAEYISNANLYTPYIRICGSQCTEALESIENWSYPLDSDGRVKEGEKPIHNEYSHYGSALYYGLAGRFPVKKMGGVTLR